MLTPIDIHAELEILYGATRDKRVSVTGLLRNNKILAVCRDMRLIDTRGKAGTIWIGPKPTWAMADEALANYHAKTRKPKNLKAPSPIRITTPDDAINIRLARMEKRQDAILSALTTLAAKMGAASGAAA